MPTPFEIAHKFTAVSEGGFVDDKRDPGGVTSHGVSLRFLRSIGQDIDGDGDVDEADIRAITAEDSEEIFKEHFWDAAGLDRFPALTAIALYDCSVNAGPGRAARCLQEALNFYPGEVIKVDGKIGPKTLARVRTIARQGDCALAMRCVRSRRAFYVRLIVDRPELACFRKGWINRCGNLESYLKAVSVQLGLAGDACAA